MLSRVKRIFTLKKSIPREEIQLRDVQLIQKFASVARSLNFPTNAQLDKESLLSTSAELISDIIRSAPETHIKVVGVYIDAN